MHIRILHMNTEEKNRQQNYWTNHQSHRWHKKWKGQKRAKPTKIDAEKNSNWDISHSIPITNSSTFSLPYNYGPNNYIVYERFFHGIFSIFARLRVIWWYGFNSVCPSYPFLSMVIELNIAIPSPLPLSVFVSFFFSLFVCHPSEILRQVAKIILFKQTHQIEPNFATRLTSKLRSSGI